MAIPKATRVIYTKNPLLEVTCQLRFSTILKISSQPPVGFQEQIRKQFPVFSVAPERNAYHFASEDGKWLLVLEASFLALTARKYDRWENFKPRLEASLAALRQEYNPPFFSRVGLRYRNLIRPSALQLKGESWAKLLNSQATVALSWPDFAGEVTSTRSEALINLNGSKTRLRVNHGLVTVRGTDEKGYLIDNDFFTDGKTEAGDVYQHLETFHTEGGRFFRWWVTDKLHKAMGPENP